jgi:hypothetical protein
MEKKNQNEDVKKTWAEEYKKKLEQDKNKTWADWEKEFNNQQFDAFVKERFETSKKEKK